MEIIDSLRFYVASWKLQLKAAAALRTAFWTQVFGMVINNMAIILAWYFLFHSFGTINGWSVKEMVGLQGINMLIFGLVMLTSYGIMELPRHVDRGSLDGLLVKPKPVLLQLSGSHIEVTTLGDVGLGILLTVLYAAISPFSLASTLLFIASLIIGVVIAWCFLVLLPNILAFYVYDSDSLTRYLSFMFLDSSLYPTGVLTGIFRTFLLVVFPGLLAGAVPLETLRQFGWQEVAIGAVVTLFWLKFSLWLFRKSLRRYESSNLVGAR
jgi:ABC-2 type transport system permease protein